MTTPKQIETNNVGDIFEPQVMPELAMDVLKRMPDSLLAISDLKELNYSLANAVYIPGFDEQGNLVFSKIQGIKAADFPREQDHPGRIMIGNSSGTTIFPTALPKTLSENQTAIWFYQLHTLLHEFFHTIDYKKRDSEIRSKIIFEVDGDRFSLEDWWNAFTNVVVSGVEPEFVSRYAKTYQGALNEKTRVNNPERFTEALAEGVCESFAAYQLGLAPNEGGWTSFKDESFGNKSLETAYRSGDSPSANFKWILMDRLCRARVVINQ